MLEFKFLEPCKPISIDLFGLLNVLPNSNPLGIKCFVSGISISFKCECHITHYYGIILLLYNTQRILNPGDLNWVQHWVSQIGLNDLQPFQYYMAVIELLWSESSDKLSSSGSLRKQPAFFDATTAFLTGFSLQNILTHKKITIAFVT